MAVTESLAIISGGPGTGKTTTVAQILECLLEENPGLRIALAAPTGKATSRMDQSMRMSVGRGFLPKLSEVLAKDEARPEGERQVKGRTIHKWLLSPTPAGGFPGPGNPLPVDVIVVDEASMVDIHLAARLFDAVGEATRVIILGDKHQLAAVGPGAVFAELSDPKGMLGGHVVELEKSRRFEKGTVIATRANAQSCRKTRSSSGLLMLFRAVRMRRAATKRAFMRRSSPMPARPNARSSTARASRGKRAGGSTGSSEATPGRSSTTAMPGCGERLRKSSKSS